MTQSAQSPQPDAVSLAMNCLKEVVQAGDDAALTRFMHGYALGFAADQFIGAMGQPGQRVEFLVAIAKSYPEDWKKTVETLGQPL